MNIDYLRRSLKDKWLDYYQENRSWLTRLSVWVNCDGKRRPSSSFILATLSTLEPRFTELLPLIVDLSNHPDRIVMALGLNFDPEQELKTLQRLEAAIDEPPKYLPASESPNAQHLSRRPTKQDEACEGRGRDR